MNTGSTERKPPDLLSAAERRFLETERVARLATADGRARPHVVPVCFALAECTLYIAIDEKPKRADGPPLKRLRNIAENPRVSLLVDHYADDWTQLWWARADGTAVVERAGVDHAAHWHLLAAKYPQYAGQALDGPVIVVTVESWSGWSFA